MGRRSVAAFVLFGVGCAVGTSVARPTPEAPSRKRADELGPPVRVALATGASVVELTASGAWRVYDAHGGVVVRGVANDRWTVERRGDRLRLTRDGTASAWRDGALVLRTVEAAAYPIWKGKRYRGELVVSAGADSGLLVVDRVPLEWYLRSVVPLEIGQRDPAERAAVEAQAVAARSYTVVRLRESVGRPYDLLATVTDQLYGGVDAERSLTDAGIVATAGEVLTFGGRPVSAPYSSTCGGSTAEATELWRTVGEPFLRPVSDRVPGTDRYYCDIAPRFRWERTFGDAELATLMEQYLRNYAAGPSGVIGELRSVAVDGRTPSGRAAGLIFTTDRGNWRVRGNDVRYVLRSSSGELLNSTYFSVEPVIGRGNRLTQLVIRGTGYGHGVGLCQWGAIARARAGQTYRVILQTYFPGTSIGHVE